MVRSDRLAGVVSVADGTTATLFTVPAGETWLVKRVCAYHVTSALPTKVFWSLVDPANNAAPLYAPPLNSASADDHETWWALDAGCDLTVGPVGGGTVFVSVFGSKLIGVA